MTAEVLDEWVRKAEGDFNTACREGRVASRSNYDAACLHSQQCAEKYLKAFLMSNNARFVWTHNLIQLLGDCTKIDPTFEFVRNECSVLNGMLRLRYPSDFAAQEDARLAIANVKVVREFVRDRMGLKRKGRKR